MIKNAASTARMIFEHIKNTNAVVFTPILITHLTQNGEMTSFYMLINAQIKIQMLLLSKISVLSKIIL
ncbi:MAG: hypothetical protein A2315_12030 [Ignavibacteria bacterium RIFOXYB2_FULL_35_12]|nr:MAG: hypothetical protein A2006_05160 [Ignavibacteria bacterium GWC2_35_8]OGU61779.1 MAG: hypothetical protein A2X60_00115 [Ignavibacteria bacterium GWF2_35_20]OGU78766.1 MAG: hypothetical protein A2W11_06690 [Ignavibacteria bacterium RBG_16_35_7]OGU85828.1 MAG: hypothetical protein A3K31_07870 [Ignavibacteria bacterium RIFOXYA12_FULL_35_25]OGU89583.1 MAG: hypothetical protein A2492_11140 [Ignavibacteria bacterium RIFOXYC12_FULL_35_11]OGU96515.1 MAG: hypothetical protein A2347_10670 [Ignavi